MRFGDTLWYYSLFVWVCSAAGFVVWYIWDFMIVICFVGLRFGGRLLLS